MTAFSVVPTRSAAVRTYRERHVLAEFADRMVAVGLSGYIFFGSSVLISAKVGDFAQPDTRLFGRGVLTSDEVGAGANCLKSIQRARTG
jgi:hypothetical protein